MTEKKTGYPSIDRPQNQWYRNKPIRDIDVEQTVYELVFNSNKDNMSDSALEYMGVMWSFEKLKAETDRAADAFVKIGLKLGDTVLIGVSNAPESVVSLLALNKLGVVSKWFDIRASEKDIEQSANESNCKVLIAFDMLLPKIEPILNNTKLEKVIIIKPVGALPKYVQIAYSIKNKCKLPKDSRYIYFDKLVKTGAVRNTPECVPFDRNRPSIMIQSSGTTGKAKTIVHSDFSATVCVQKLAYADLPLGRGKSLLVYLPPWIAYALGDAIIYALALGSKVVLSPTFDPDKIANHLGKFTICFTAPICYRYLKDHFDELTAKQKLGLKMIECLVSGGDKITSEENAELERVLGTVLVNGYGNNEGWGALTVNPTKHNKYGTVGIPKYGETIIAYDNDTESELKYGEEGEICSLTETMFLGYEGKEAETNAVKKMHPDGKVWLHTGDLGCIDEDGFVVLKGRLRRVIVRRAFKISAYTIEDLICQHSAVKECVAVEVNDPDEEHVPMAYIVLQEGVEDVEAAKCSIREMCIAELKDYEVPKYYRFIDAMPYTPNNKYDFRLLEKLGNDYISNQNGSN